MCAIVDNNVRSEVFGGDSQTEAGRLFLDRLGQKRQLVVGGKLLQELCGYDEFSRWLKTAMRLGYARGVDEDEVDAETRSLQNEALCRSNDEHIIALARVSGARLLFTNDLSLQKDFKDQHLINSPRGAIYTTVRSKHLTSTHKNLLKRTDLCAA